MSPQERLRRFVAHMELLRHEGRLDDAHDRDRLLLRDVLSAELARRRPVEQTQRAQRLGAAYPTVQRWDDEDRPEPPTHIRREPSDGDPPGNVIPMPRAASGDPWGGRQDAWAPVRRDPTA